MSKKTANRKDAVQTPDQAGAKESRQGLRRVLDPANHREEALGDRKETTRNRQPYAKNGAALPTVEALARRSA
jgi:hypothetical protein